MNPCLSENEGISSISPKPRRPIRKRKLLQMKYSLGDFSIEDEELPKKTKVRKRRLTSSFLRQLTDIEFDNEISSTPLQKRRPIDKKYNCRVILENLSATRVEQIKATLKQHNNKIKLSQNVLDNNKCLNGSIQSASNTESESLTNNNEATDEQSESNTSASSFKIQPKSTSASARKSRKKWAIKMNFEKYSSPFATSSHFEDDQKAEPTPISPPERASPSPLNETIEKTEETFKQTNEFSEMTNAAKICDRRSTFTLEETVNELALLNSTPIDGYANATLQDNVNQVTSTIYLDSSTNTPQIKNKRRQGKSTFDFEQLEALVQRDEAEQNSSHITICSDNEITPKNPYRIEELRTPSSKRVFFCDPSVILISDSDNSPDVYLAQETTAAKSSFITPKNTRKVTFSDKLQTIPTLQAPKLLTPFVKSMPKTPTFQNCRNNSSSSRTPKRTKMPNFSKIHEKIFNKMENLQEHSQRKANRAKQLLTATTTTTKPSNKIVPVNLMIRKPLASKLPVPCKPVTSVPQTKQVPKTVFGFQVKKAPSAPTKDERQAAANKTRVQKVQTDENRKKVQGYRTNRRFELLMKMRGYK